MKIIHNTNNWWQDEIKVFGEDEHLFKWVESLLESEKKASREEAFDEFLKIVEGPTNTAEDGNGHPVLYVDELKDKIKYLRFNPII